MSRIIGASAVAAGSALGLVLLLAAATRSLEAAIRTPDQAVALGVLSIGALVLLWYLATAVAALACAVARAAGHASVAAEQRLRALGAPLARRLLLTGGSAAVVAAATLSPAAAAPAPSAPEGLAVPVVTLSDDLGWGAGNGGEGGDEPPTGTPEVADDEESPDTETTEATGAAEPAASSTEADQHTVAPGDSLWSIAARHLPADSTNADVAAAWPRWYEQNRGVIGEDPDLIHPGQVLAAPGHDLEEEA